MKFVIIDNGDESVGIPGYTEIIDFPGDWNEEDIEYIEKFLRELYDIGNNGSVVLETDYINAVNAENEYYEMRYLEDMWEE